MILRDEDGVEWDCSEIGGASHATDPADGNGFRKVFRVLRCRRLDDPHAAAHHVSFPAHLDLSDPSIQQWVLAGPPKRQ